MLKESSIVQLVEMDSDQAIDLFVDHNEEIPSHNIVTALQVGIAMSQLRHLLIYDIIAPWR